MSGTDSKSPFDLLDQAAGIARPAATPVANQTEKLADEKPAGGISGYTSRLIDDGLTPEEASATQEPYDYDDEGIEQSSPLLNNPNVTLQYPYSTRYHFTALNLERDGVAVPCRRATEESGDFLDAHFVGDAREETVNYALTHETARKLTPSAQGMGEQAIDRTGSDWRQYLSTERGKLGYMAPRAGDPSMSVTTGRRALQRARSMMGLGGEISVPLLRSGFWVTIAAPQDSDLIELNRRIANEKIEFGRLTHGLAYSNQESFMMGWLVDFALRHVVDSTLRNQEDLKSRIDVLDYHALLWGLVKTIYPRGYNYSRAITVTADNIRSRRLITALIDVTKIFWIDNSFFNDKQRAHMAHRQSASVTDEAVAEYRKGLRLSEGRRVDLWDGVAVVLKVPNVQEQVDSAHTWINEINATIDRTFTSLPPDDDERNSLIGLHSRTSQTRNYASWVSEVLVEGEQPITDLQDINDFLTDLSKNQEKSAYYISEIKRFINDNTCAIVAVPETSGEDDVSLPEFPQLIPINVASTFFILLVQSVKRTAARKQLV